MNNRFVWKWAFIIAGMAAPVVVFLVPRPLQTNVMLAIAIAGGLVTAIMYERKFP